MALVLAFYEKKLRILYQRSHSDFIKLKYGELLSIRHISIVKPRAENPEQKWRIAESMKCASSSNSFAISWRPCLWKA